MSSHSVNEVRSSNLFSICKLTPLHLCALFVPLIMSSPFHHYHPIFTPLITPPLCPSSPHFCAPCWLPPLFVDVTLDVYNPASCRKLTKLLLPVHCQLSQGLLTGFSWFILS